MARGRGIRGLSKLIEQIPAEVVADVELGFAVIAEQEAASDGMGTISPNGNGPYPLTTKADRAKVTKTSASLVVYGTPAGFWAWLEDGVPRHEVGRARRKRRTDRTDGRGGRFQAVSTPNGPVSVAHASFPQRGTWSRVEARVDDELEGVVVDVLDRLDL